MRTTFELRILAATLAEAKQIAIEEISAFLGIDEKDVTDAVSIELRVSYAKAETRAEIAQELDNPDFVVTVLGSVKQSVIKPL